MSERPDHKVPSRNGPAQRSRNVGSVVLVWVVGNLFLLVPMVRFAMQLSESRNGPLGYNFSGIGYGLAFGIFALAFGAFNVLALVAALVVAIIAVSRRVRAAR